MTAGIPKVGATWFYNWRPNPQASLDAGPVASGIEPVAMIKTLADHTSDILGTVNASYKTVLGFNEPNGNNITAQQAVDAWPDIIATGLRIGSPAPAATHTPQPGVWIYDFMKGINNSVDFIALHFYSANPDWVAELEKYVTDVYQMYQKPIWVTEFAMVNYSGSSYTTPDVQTEAQNVISACQMLNSLSFVDRYAWFAIPQNSYQPNTYLFDNTSAITVIGEAYSAVP